VPLRNLAARRDFALARYIGLLTFAAALVVLAITPGPD